MAPINLDDALAKKRKINLDVAAVSSSDGGGRVSSLPEDVRGLIFDKVSNSVYDYIRCATVCKSWFQHAAQLLQQHDMKKKHHQLPLLLSPSLTVYRSLAAQRSQTYRIRQISSSSSSLIRVPYDFKKLCGSSQGWLIFAEYGRAAALTLFNPFTAATIHLPLPALLLHCGYGLEIRKVVLSDDPSSNPDNYEVLSLQTMGRLALFTPRFGRWIYGDDYFDNYYWGHSLSDDIIYFKGKFHALLRGKLGSVEIYDDIHKEDDNKPASSYIRLEPLKGVVDEIGNLMGAFDTYLAESISGTLLFIQRSFRGIYYVFRVYELEEEEEEEADSKRFILLLHEGGEGRGLGDQTLFLGKYHSTSVRACDFPGCKPNSIYFTHNSCSVPELADKPYSVSVYNLGDEHGGKPLYCMLEDSQFLSCTLPIWIEPRPNLNL